MVMRIMLDFAQKETLIQLLPVLATRKDHLLLDAERVVVIADRKESCRVGTTAVEKYLQEKLKGNLVIEGFSPIDYQRALLVALLQMQEKMQARASQKVLMMAEIPC